MADDVFQTFYPPLKAIDNGDGTYSVAVVMKGIPALSGLAVGDVLIADSATSAVWTPHDGVLDAHTRNVLQTIRTGEYYTHIYAYHGVKAILADRLYGVPLVVARDMTVDRIGIEVTVPAGGMSARLGIYNADGVNLYPGSLLVDAGIVSINAAAVVAAVVAQSLTKGIYFMAIIPEANCTIRGQITYRGYIPIMGIDGTLNFTAVRGSWRVIQAYGALPDPFTAGGADDAYSALNVFPRILSLD